MISAPADIISVSCSSCSSCLNSGSRSNLAAVAADEVTAPTAAHLEVRYWEERWASGECGFDDSHPLGLLWSATQKAHEEGLCALPESGSIAFSCVSRSKLLAPRTASF